jgi:hypothetical protein
MITITLSQGTLLRRKAGTHGASEILVTACTQEVCPAHGHVLVHDCRGVLTVTAMITVEVLAERAEVVPGARSAVGR